MPSPPVRVEVEVEKRGKESRRDEERWYSEEEFRSPRALGKRVVNGLEVERNPWLTWLVFIKMEFRGRY